MATVEVEQEAPDHEETSVEGTSRWRRVLLVTVITVVLVGTAVTLPVMLTAWNGQQNSNGTRQTGPDTELPVPLQWSEWAQWTRCHVTCGNGIRIRVRHCITMTSKHHGSKCNGTKEEQIQNCDMRSCGVHRPPENGLQFGSRDLVGDLVSFVCKPDYVLVGDWKRVCLLNCLWSGEQPYCRRNCSDPGYPRYGFRTEDKFWEGETVTYHCHIGYLLIGSLNRTCNSSGLWDGQLPLCRRNCSEPGHPRNGYRVGDKLWEGETVTYRCNGNYSLVGSPNSTCNSSGLWDGQLPRCRFTINSTECRNYTSLTDADRRDSYANINIQCDNRLTPGWYRFAGGAGTRMLDSCTNPAGSRCNTHGTSWLSGGHPTVADGEVNRRVCFSYVGNCCYHRESIDVRNCGSFYVYKLRPTRSCSFRYCGTS